VELQADGARSSLMSGAQPNNAMIFKTYKLFQDLSMQQHLELLHKPTSLDRDTSFLFKRDETTMIIDQTNKQMLKKKNIFCNVATLV